MTRRAVPGGFVVSLSGVIDERLEQRALREGLSGVVLFDLDQVQRITSFGIREWMRGLKGLVAEYCGFVRCRPALVAQFNTVADFSGKGELLSFYGRYQCRHCGLQFEQLIDLRRQHEQVKAFNAPAATCARCQQPAEFDDVAADYFSHAASLPPPRPPPQVQAALDGAEAAAPFRVRKSVSDTATTLTVSGGLHDEAHFKRLFDGLEGLVSVNLRQVTAATPAAARALQESLKQPNARVWLVGVPPALFAPMAADPSGKGQAQIASVLVPLKCPACQHVTSCEVGARGLDLFAAGQPCAQCAVPVVPERAQVLAIRLLALASPPPELSTDEGAHSEPVSAPVAFGRYQLLKPLGLGGMAEVFLARQTGVGGFEKKVVLKRILPHLAQDPRFVSLLLREARVAGRISHPNVVQTLDVGQADGRYYIAMEYVKGWDLNTVLRLSALTPLPLPVGLACRVVAEVLGGLDAAHRAVDDQGLSLGIIHRDVSPHNVLLSTTGEVKLTDFGIARAAGSVDAVTPSISLKGKLAWLAPEQLNPNLGPTDARADLFPCGLMLFQCLTGQPPFRKQTDLSTINAVLFEPVPSLRERRPLVPIGLQAIVERALSRVLEQRYPDAHSMRSELEQVMASLGEPVMAKDLAAWLQQLVTAAREHGRLGPDEGFTPSTPRP